jgi:hypothetical protein
LSFEMKQWTPRRRKDWSCWSTQLRALAAYDNAAVTEERHRALAMRLLSAEGPEMVRGTSAHGKSGPTSRNG